MMKAGALDRRITIQREVQTGTDAYNVPIMEWVDLATVAAAVTPVSDGERWRAAEVSAEVTTRFLIRYSPQVADVNPKDRIRYEGRLYDIYGVKEVGRREGLEITATARADQ